ncbi:DUF1803 domain-containing protein [Streptococcus macacae]|uniref:PF08820 domain protein n=1 Tax=Streptococcus macacae NCTC 11558 TaxID=764298 RepID=G5JYB3_9STRE|nr:DUF1803 domain-containing protein [Streptococcus macacae]EHJ51848.1 hypothetical protein STRMA_0174 [Streptococcus macacae NCTC 11558]SUN78027.1 hypothetical cytosolic protein [Streptococcus macacae NCTC 11558]
MIKIFNADKLARQPFFLEFINYLQKHNDVNLRQIKKDFAAIKHLERSIEDYVQAGYILRQNKRYYNAFELLETLDGLTLDSQIFVDDDSAVYQDLLQVNFETRLPNRTNAALIVEETNITRDSLTLSNYFFKLKEQLPLSREQKPLYDLLGDVNQEYALKYMTSFLLKFGRKEIVKQKRRDIFVDSLTILGYLTSLDEQTYSLNMTFDKEKFIFIS